MKSETLRAEARKLNDQAGALWKRHDGTSLTHTEGELAEFDALIAKRDQLVAEADAIDRREKALNATDYDTNGRDLPHNDPSNTRNGRIGYSLLRAYRAMDPNNKFGALDGIELETHQELVKRRAAGGHQVQGVLVPYDLPVDTHAARRFSKSHGIEARDLTISTGSGAVVNATLPTMIELLRNIALLSRLGMVVMNDMSGNFSIPRESAGATVYWIDPEAASVTASNQTIGSVAFAPKTIGLSTVYSRSFLSQSSIDAEMFVRQDHVLGLAIGLDKAGVAGTGSGSQPTGILYDSNVNVVAIGTNGGAPTWAKVAELERAVEVANALDGNLAYLTSPKGRYKLKTTVKDSNTAARYLWNDDKPIVNGYPAYSTNQVPATLTKGSGTGLTALIFGDFSQAVMAFWGAADVIVNPYTNAKSGAVEITTLQDADFHLRHSDAFGVIKDLDPA